MDPVTSHHVIPATIATSVENCEKAFKALCSADSTPLDDSGFKSSDAMDLFDRFKVWAGNIAAHRTGKASLDYRLRDASQLRELVLEYLDNLEEYLIDAIAIVNGERIPWDAEDDQSSTTTDGDETDLDFTEIQQLKAQISETITCLMRLSMTIRNPVPRDLITEYSNVDTTAYQEFDIAHVREKFPDAEDYLTSRLGKAISRRRQTLKQWDDRHERLSQRGLAEHKSTTETVATSLQSQLEKDKRSFAEDIESDTGVTTTSYASTAQGRSSIRQPSLPSGAHYGVPFECNLCFRIILVATYDSWKKHTYHDLYPYVCTLEDCSMPNRLFDSRRNWFEHETKMHRGPWTCFCNVGFSSTSSLSAHLRADHHETIGTSDIMDLIESLRYKGFQKGPNCPLCKHATAGLSQLQKHLGRHLQELALFALPSNVTEDEADDSPDLDSVSSGADEAIRTDDHVMDITKPEGSDGAAAYFAAPGEDSRGRVSPSTLRAQRLGEQLLAEEMAEMRIDRHRSHSRDRLTEARRHHDEEIAALEQQIELERRKEEAMEVEAGYIRKEEDAAADRQLLIEDYERKRIADAQAAKDAELAFRSKLDLQTREELEREKRAYEDFLYRQRENEAREEETYREALRKQKEKEEAREREYQAFLQDKKHRQDTDEVSVKEQAHIDSIIRARLQKLGYPQDEIELALDPEKAEKGASPARSESFALGGHVPVFPRINRKHLDVETLEYYHVPWEWDRANPEYMIILRGLDKYETDVLFEHTRRRRENVSKPLLDGESKEKAQNFPWVKIRSKERSTSRNRDIRITEIVRR